MCLIVVRDHAGPSAAGFPFDAAWAHNPDGFGIAFTDGRRIYLHKTLKKRNAKRLLKAAIAGPHLFIAHFRFRTRGAKTINNIHPFRLGKHSAVMAHNGTLETDEGPLGESDSVMFTRNVLTPLADLAGLSPLFHPNSKIGKMIEFMTRGSRIALLRANGDTKIYGDGWTSWRDLKCSNAYSLKKPTYHNFDWKTYDWSKSAEPQGYYPERPATPANISPASPIGNAREGKTETKPTLTEEDVADLYGPHPWSLAREPERD